MMRSKESVEYSYQAEKSIFGIALRAPKGDHSVLGNGSAIIHFFDCVHGGICAVSGDVTVTVQT